MKQIFVMLLYYIITQQVTAQNIDKVTFEKKSHDFGSFSEDGDNQRYDFKFTNHRKEAMAITHVQTSCGCATADYTRTPILPGKTGVISIIYNPKGRPGKFSRSVLVSFSGIENKVKLEISGTVIPGVVRKDKRFPYVMGDLQLRTTGFRFSPMRGEEQERSIKVINSGKIPLRLVFRSSNPIFTGYMEPSVLSPDSTGDIRISRKMDDTKEQIKCIRLKEDHTLPQKTGYIYIEITTEECK